MRLAAALARAPATAARSGALFAATPTAAAAFLTTSPLAGFADRTPRPARHAHAVRSRADCWR